MSPEVDGQPGVVCGQVGVCRQSHKKYNSVVSERNDKRGGVAGCALGLGLLLVILSVLYVLGIGPATWIGEHYPDTQGFLEAAYLPLAFLAENCEPIGMALDWYLGFWY